MRWMLDTNIWISYLKNASSPVLNHLQKHTPSEILTCSIIRAELLHGALKYGVVSRRLAIVTETLRPYVSLGFDDLAAEHYSRIRHDLEVSGRVIGAHDLLIAAICLANDCVLVTSNTEEFSRVAGLSIEDWAKSDLA